MGRAASASLDALLSRTAQSVLAGRMPSLHRRRNWPLPPLMLSPAAKMRKAGSWDKPTRLRGHRSANMTDEQVNSVFPGTVRDANDDLSFGVLRQRPDPSQLLSSLMIKGPCTSH